MAGAECPSPPPASLVQALSQEGQEPAPPPGSRLSGQEGPFVLGVGTQRPRERADCPRSPSNSKVGPKVYLTFNPASFLIWNVV